MSWEDGDGPDYPEGEDPLQGHEIAAVPAQAAVPGKPITRVVIEADHWDETRLSNMVLGRVAQMVEERTRKAIERQIERTVNEVIREVVQAKVAAAVEVIMAEGWTPTDSYGSASGPKKTLKDRVSEMLMARDRYGNSLTYLDQTVANEVNKVLAGELGKAIEEAKKKVRETLDSAVMTKLQQALKEGLGLKA